MKCVVLRSFPGPGGKVFQAGETVDSSDWKNQEALINQRYMRARRPKVTDSPIAEKEFVPPPVKSLAKKTRKKTLEA